jgi:hypothetical protein
MALTSDLDINCRTKQRIVFIGRFDGNNLATSVLKLQYAKILCIIIDELKCCQ